MKLIDMNQMISKELREKASYVKNCLTPVVQKYGYKKTVYQYDPTTKEEYIYVFRANDAYCWAVCVTASSLTEANHEGGDLDLHEALVTNRERRIYRIPIAPIVVEACEYVDEHWCNNVRCKRCGHLVLTSDADGYKFQCLHHDEDLVGFEAVESPEVDPTQNEYDELVKLVVDEILS